MTDALDTRARADGAAPARDARSPQSPGDQLKAALREFLAALLERTFGMALDKLEQLSRTLDDMEARGGYKVGAAFGGVRAVVAGRSPVWGAIRGAFSRLSPGVKAAIIVVLVLALLLLPVTVVLLLLLLIAVAIIAIVKSRSRA